MLRISTSLSSASCQWVMSACQRSLGWAALNRCQVDFGRFCGCAVTNPRRVSTRQIVETAGTGSSVEVFDLGVRRARWVWMVSAPASRPCLDNSLRSRTICSSMPGDTWLGWVKGRRDRGS